MLFFHADPSTFGGVDEGLMIFLVISTDGREIAQARGEVSLEPGSRESLYSG